MLQTISPHSTLFERPLNFVQKLQANVSYMHEYRQACLLAFTETWLVCHVQDSNLLIDGFGTPIIPYKNKCDTGKDHPGGYVSILTQYGAIQLLVALHAGHCTPVGVTPAILSTKGIPPAFFSHLFMFIFIHAPISHHINKLDSISQTLRNLCWVTSITALLQNVEDVSFNSSKQDSCSLLRFSACSLHV